MNRVSKILIASVVALASAHAQGGTIVCSGTIESLQFDATSTSGYLSIRLSSMNTPVYFCDPDGTFSAAGNSYSISATACRTLYATFLAAKAGGQSLTNVYFDGTSVPATCDGWSQWQAANIR